MENASKALLIAGAILIAIVLISLGVMILGTGGDIAKNNSNSMSETEVLAYNDKFKSYIGENVRGTVVLQLLDKVKQHNLSNENDFSKQVATEYHATVAEVTNGDALSRTLDLEKAADVVQCKTSDIRSGSTYALYARYSKAGLISKIYICRK